MTMKNINKEYHTAGSSGRANACPRMTGESGRSMVEMLGVLAVIGVLSVAGIAGYSNAMKKHRVNEILNEASKRAVLVAAQAMTGKTDSISLGEFTQNTFSGVTFANTATVADNKITLTLSGSGLSDICDQLKDATGDNTVIKITKDDCTELTFNADMSTGNASNNTPPLSACPTGSSTSGLGGNTGVKDGGNMCKCENADEVYTPSGCEDISTNCPSGLTKDGSGRCVCTDHTTNQCGLGYYCQFSPSDCGDSDRGDGVCKPVSYIGDYSTETVNGHEYTMSSCSNCPDWWSAQSWCQAFGKTMVTLGDLHCSSSGCTDTLWQDLGNALYQYIIWTQDLTEGPNSCDAFDMDLEYGNVGNNDRDNNYSLDVLCRE